MSSKTVVSPAKERIEIVDDADWIATAGVTEKALRMWNLGVKRFLIADMWLHGSVSDESGRVMTLWHARASETFGDLETSPQAITGLLNAPLNAAAFTLQKGTRRTYYAKMVALPRYWYEKLQLDIAVWEGQTKEVAIDQVEVQPIDQVEVQSVDELTPESANGTKPDHSIMDAELEAILHGPDAPTVYDIAPPMELAIASQVAMSLLTTCVEIITAGSSESVDARVRKLTGDMEDVQHKLHLRLTENDTLRRQVREAGDQIIALRAERDGLRSRLRATEANLTSALKGDAVQAINGEIQRRVESIMRVAPTAKGDDA